VAELTEPVSLDVSDNALRGDDPLPRLDLPCCCSNFWRCRGTTDSAGLSPPSWAGCRTGLQLESNSSTGTIPTELGRLSRLQHVALRNNEHTGINSTEVGDQTILVVWESTFNELTGRIPTERGRLTDLEEFTSWINGEFTSWINGLSGTIPSEIGRFARLVEWRTAYSGMSGPISTEIGRLTALEVFLSTDNVHTGPIPTELAGLSRLMGFEVAGNVLFGPIPPSVGDGQALTALHIGVVEPAYGQHPHRGRAVARPRG
jgi:hypothetical protein